MSQPSNNNNTKSVKIRHFPYLFLLFGFSFTILYYQRYSYFQLIIIKLVMQVADLTGNCSSKAANLTLIQFKIAA